MAKKQILRIEVDRDAFLLVESEAFIQHSTMKAIASDILRKHVSKAAVETARNRDHDVITSSDHRDETPEKQKVEESERDAVIAGDSKPVKRILARDQAAIAKIKELWAAGERNQAEIARQIDYPPSTVRDRVRKMLDAGEITESSSVIIQPEE